jgi:hypothetical protein
MIKQFFLIYIELYYHKTKKKNNYNNQNFPGNLNNSVKKFSYH